MPFAERQTHRLHFEIQGPEGAPPLLLIMGMGFPARAWHALPDRLAESFRVLTFDNRGTGSSTPGRGLFRIRDMAEDAVAVLDAAGLARAHVFGVSMGGMIALELVLNAPERVRSLALGATFAGHLRAVKPPLGTLRDLLVARTVPRSRAVPIFARFLVSKEYLAREPGAFERWLARCGPPSTGVLMRQLAAVVRHATESRLPRIDAPTLVITGDRDRLVPVENSRRLARAIRGARLVELAGAGHCFPLERPAETVKALSDHFLPSW